ncbi:MAG: Hpt domain-containing protein [Gammaproteobacteria bacterium]|nr:Hpt domain-containing protein [Gammaproteobacteria bacterium]MCW5583440.1 Hpt domain-containing protein [Gammaproteobacteria bacterium]
MDLANLPVIDWEQTIKLAGNNRKFAEDMLDLFIKSLPSDVSLIKVSYEAQNYLEMLRAVHKLHGALCYCGLPRLKTMAAHLETELKNNIMDGLPSLIEQFDTEVILLLEHYSRLPTRESQGL